jgi:hypothetical protein
MVYSNDNQADDRNDYNSGGSGAGFGELEFQNTTGSDLTDSDPTGSKAAMNGSFVQDLTCREKAMRSNKHLDNLLKEWEFDPKIPSVRLVKGGDNRDVLQMRVDLGLLQMETQGRPDGRKPKGHASYLDYLLDAEERDADFNMTDEDCFEVDREFVQYYQRRISWLRLQHYHRAIEDADHTLALMDVCLDHCNDEDWTISHEQYRPFVLFQRTQAAALAALDDAGAQPAIAEINKGLEAMLQVFTEHDAEDQFEDDEMVEKLTELRSSLRNQYKLGPSLEERLAEAVKSEQYELAAQLRDELAKQAQI